MKEEDLSLIHIYTSLCAMGSSANLYWALARPSPITSPRRVAEAAAAEEAVTFRVQTAFLPLGDTDVYKRQAQRASAPPARR